MKWFKHYTDASGDDGINRLEQEFGYEGYGVYWKILEKCAAKWDGKSDPVFVLNKVKTRLELRLKSVKTEFILGLMSVCKLCELEVTEFDYIIRFPKMAEIKDNHTKNLQASGNLLASNLPLEQIRTDKIRIKQKAAKSPSSKLVDGGAIVSPEFLVIDYLNATLKKSFMQTDSNHKPIKARLKEGYTVEQMKTLIDHIGKVWVYDSFWQNQIKIPTIFSIKFDGYYQEAITKNSDPIEDFFAANNCAPMEN